MLRIESLRDVPEYLETLGRWHHKEWSYLNPSRTLEMRFNSMKEHLEGKPIPTTWVAIFNGKLAGSAALKVTDMPERPELTPWLASVFVEPTSRKLGIGRQLVLRVMEHAKTIGVKTMYLYTPDREHFYSHLGWQSIEKTVYHNTNITIMKFDITT